MKKKPYDTTKFTPEQLFYIYNTWWNKRNKKGVIEPGVVCKTRGEYTHFINKKFGTHKSYDLICRILRGEYTDKFNHLLITKRVSNADHKVHYTQLQFKF